MDLPCWSTPLFRYLLAFAEPSSGTKALSGTSKLLGLARMLLILAILRASLSMPKWEDNIECFVEV